MILSVSRRTDIPTYFSDWFFNRIKDQYVMVRNPMNIHQVSKINLNPEVIDGIVFWTKNPKPMLNRLNNLKDYIYYFQFTLNAYDNDVERNIPSKNKVIIPVFQEVSDIIGPDRVIWRYDPIFINNKYTIDYHIKYFEILARRISPYTKRCIISFLDFYKKIEKNIETLSIYKISFDEQEYIARKLSEIAHSYNLQLETCAEAIDLSKYGIQHSHCIDTRLFEKLLGCKLNTKKDKNQREECGCFESIDIGAYNTCKNGCIYCYANFNNKIVNHNLSTHNPYSPLFYGELTNQDVVYERVITSCKINQPEFDLF